MKRIITTLLLFFMLVSVLTACADTLDEIDNNESQGIKAQTVDKWDGSVAEAFSGGEGSEDSPFEISSATELAYLAKSVNDGTDYSGKHFVMKCDLDLCSGPLSETASTAFRDFSMETVRRSKISKSPSVLPICILRPVIPAAMQRNMYRDCSAPALLVRYQASV